jgi:hypothetical protein
MCNSCVAYLCGVLCSTCCSHVYARVALHATSFCRITDDREELLQAAADVLILQHV